jgi:hypothetical protein
MGGLVRGGRGGIGFKQNNAFLSLQQLRWSYPLRTGLVVFFPLLPFGPWLSCLLTAGLSVSGGLVPAVGSPLCVLSFAGYNYVDYCLAERRQDSLFSVLPDLGEVRSWPCKGCSYFVFHNIVILQFYNTTMAILGLL